MSDEYSPQGRALIEVGRAMYAPTAEDRARARAVFAAHLGAAPRAASGLRNVFGASSTKGFVAVIVAGMLGAGVRYTARGHLGPAAHAVGATTSSPRPSQRAAATSEVRAPATPPLVLEPAPRASAPTYAAPAPGGTPTVHGAARVLRADGQPSSAAAAPPLQPIEITSAVATLAAVPVDAPSATSGDSEPALLYEARIAMATGHPFRALARLDEGAGRFPHGRLRTARRAVRVLVLCMLGRRDEASDERARVLAAVSTGPYADMVRGSCAPGAASEPIAPIAIAPP